MTKFINFVRQQYKISQNSYKWMCHQGGGGQDVGAISPNGLHHVRQYPGMWIVIFRFKYWRIDPHCE